LHGWGLDVDPHRALQVKARQPRGDGAIGLPVHKGAPDGVADVDRDQQPDLEDGPGDALDDVDRAAPGSGPRRLVLVTSRPLIAQIAHLLLDRAEPADGHRAVHLSHPAMAHLLEAPPVRHPGLAERRGPGLVSTRYGVTVLEDELALRQAMGRQPPP
jgi:hypothetical protein